MADRTEPFIVGEYTDEQANLLRLVFEERRNSIGFELDPDLTDARVTALDYYKGDMSGDMPAPANRSKAISTDVSDAIETVLPDLMDIFTGGEDVATFQPTSPRDEDAAKQETDYLNHVIMVENEGFRLFYTLIKDALLIKTGVVKWWWEASEYEDEPYVGVPADQFAVFQQALREDGPLEVRGLKQRTDDATGQPVVDFTLCRHDGRARVAAFPPNDFSVARDTVDLKSTTYCAARSRPRAQELIAQGYPRDKVDRLPMYGAPSWKDQAELARDTAGEQSNMTAGTSGDLRIVEIVEHNLRFVNDDGEPEIWRLVTGDEESLLLLCEKVDRIQFSAITPYPVAHRFYGRSLADLLLEIQRIKTALTRMLLDSGYFALNQRNYVDMTKTNEFTITDLLRNEPGAPIRGAGEGAVTPLQSAGLSFEPTEVMEFFSTVAEGRTGIVRNAQGLNPDTLHATATGALALMSNSQKRVRMIARIFAETGFKDLFLGVHALIRTHPQQPKEVRLNGQWAQIDPTLWGERNDMTIEIGIGSGGQQHEMQAFTTALPVMQSIIQMQGGLQGPLITMQNAYAFLKRGFQRGLGIKGVDAVLTDPSTTQQPEGAQQPPPPDPKMVEAQGKLQLAQQEQQSDQQMQGQRLQMEQSTAQQKAQTDLQIAQAKLAQDAQIEKYKADQNLQLQREQMAMEAQLRREEMNLNYRAKVIGAPTQWGDMDQIGRQPGGDIG